MPLKVIGIIPVRIGSTRLSRKALRLVNGKPLIQRVWENARKARLLKQLVVACDHPEIKKTVEGFGGLAVMTRPNHLSGTSRISEAICHFNAEVAVNIQGDEPLLHPEAIDQVVKAFAGSRKKNFDIVTLAVSKGDPEEYRSPSVVKVVTNHNGMALYFSRAPIPYDRQERGTRFLKHLGIYGFRRNILLKWNQLPLSDLEEREGLEQLRALDIGLRIKVLLTKHDSISVDTEEDLRRVEAALLKQALVGKY